MISICCTSEINLEEKIAAIQLIADFAVLQSRWIS